MPNEANIEKTDKGLIVKSDGWFILHAGEAVWRRSGDFGDALLIEGETKFGQVGVNLRVLHPGQPASLYHSEGDQEDFFVVSGECLVIIEDEERKLRAGHFVHCPAGVTHLFVGAGNGPCVILMIGGRRPETEKELRYPVSPVAAKYNASAEKETTDPREAYAKRQRFVELISSSWGGGPSR